MKDFWLCVLVFVITVAETVISTWGARADRQSTYSNHNRFSLKAANWNATFELVLFVDVMVIWEVGWKLLPVILAAAWIGEYWVLEKRRHKWLAHKRQKQEREMEDDEKVDMDSDAAIGNDS